MTSLPSEKKKTKKTPQEQYIVNKDKVKGRARQKSGRRP
jgi:hypothetical protein